MAIKVTTPETKQEPKPFPKLMVVGSGLNAGTVILLHKAGYGIIVFGTGYHCRKEGSYQEELSMSCLTDYNEPITIQNA